MARAFCIPGIIFLLVALVLNFLTSVSLPYLPALDITRVTAPENVQVSGTDLREIRFGVWAYCTYNEDDDQTCNKVGNAYQVSVRAQDRQTQDNYQIVVGESWTRGLVMHPVATGFTFIAFIMSFSSHITVTLLCSLMSFFAAGVTLIAFAIDIALFAYVRNKFKDIGADTNTAPGFWLTFASLILLLLSACTVCFGRRKDRMAGASYPMTETRRPWYQRFGRRNKV